MLIPNVDVKEFEKFGFKLCRGIPRDLQCYYLCVARGCEFIFVSPKCFAIEEWRKDDSRIHERPNCRFRSDRTAIDILYDLIKADMLKKER
ncbi:hypothetical protein EHW90_00120 [Lachnoanaerobaculum orale]|uniref:Uncharacterized protein n=1 Tax=Lachnoanaerobaculum orale TaxID=979627 RepID=A0A3P3Q2N1_9FIRM|nr:hypothetical protein [Lachnoanaerobaculum orale]RRJ15492.1 hypothetical protein EHW90_00120 [Lachnoanaerobaculum orale]